MSRACQRAVTAVALAGEGCNDGGRWQIVAQCDDAAFSVTGACAEPAPEALRSIARAAKTRKLRAGSIAESGAASNPDRRRGYCFVAGKRSLEAIVVGGPAASATARGDVVAIVTCDERSAIRRRIAAPKPRRSRRRTDV